jgi:hypothetical protein
VGTLSPWTCRAAAGALALAFVTSAGDGRAAPTQAPEPEETAADSGNPATAVVVLIGPAADGPELGDVLSELLERQHIRPEIVLEERFDPSSLLSEGETDSRVWVFVVVHGGHQARLYFRGPLGKRFLLREVSLKNGLDEVGRELIAQIVETSSVALLRSTAGITRDEAKASLEKERASTEPTPSPTVKPKAEERPPNEHASSLVAVIGARGILLWNRDDAGPAVGAGAEGGLGTRFGKSFVGRARLAFEYRAPQSITTQELDASFGSVALRAAIDGGFSTGPHAFLLGLGAGVDFDRATTESVRDPSLNVAPDSTSTSATLRSELRYEVTIDRLWVSASFFTDFATVRTHYDVTRASGTTRLAELWLVRPGLALTIGWSSAAAF